MKLSVILICLLFVPSILAQEVFQKDGKWGISKYGDTNQDVLFPAIYDKIITYTTAEGYFYAGEKDDYLHPLTPGEKVNDEVYESFIEDPNHREFIYGLRDGLLDAISLTDYNFIIKGVKADGISEKMTYSLDLGEFTLVTESKEGHGLVNLADGIIILEAKYDNINRNDDFEEYVIVTKDKKKGIYNLDGKEIFQPASIEFTGIIPIDSINFGFQLFGKNYKEGFYSSINEYYVPAEYAMITWLSGNDKFIVVTNKKGDGLYYEGQMLLKCEYDAILPVDEEFEKKGYIASAVKGEETILVDDKGNVKVVMVDLSK